MLRDEKDVFAEFAKEYDGPKVDIDGNEYVPWPQVVRILDRVVGAGNWSDRVTFHEYNYERGTYTHGVELSITVMSEDFDAPKTITHYGVSTSVAQATKDERSRGLVISERPKIHETALDGSASLARTKASKSFGNIFGLNFYKHSEEFVEKVEGADAPTTRVAAKSGGTDTKKNGNYKPSADKPISEAQIGLLVKNGATRAEVENLNQVEAHQAIDAMKANGWKFVRPNGKSSSTITPADFETDGEDEINF